MNTLLALAVCGALVDASISGPVNRVVGDCATLGEMVYVDVTATTDSGGTVLGGVATFNQQTTERVYGEPFGDRWAFDMRYGDDLAVGFPVPGLLQVDQQQCTAYASPMSWDVETWPTGDANLDGIFDSSDLVSVFVAGQYEDSISDNSTWQTGDWNADHNFDSSDLVAAFKAGSYQSSASVPEPHSFVLLCCAFACRRRLFRLAILRLRSIG